MTADISRRNFLRSAAVGGVLVATGEAFAGEPTRGRVTAQGKPIGGVVVTDGLNCAETAADGTWALPGRKGVRFVSVTVPSGWKLPKHYLRFEGAAKGYDFDLEPWAASKPGAFSFVHIGDSEIQEKRLADERRWIAKTGDLVARRQAMV